MGSSVTANGADAAGAITLPATSGLVTLTTGPGVDDVTVTTIVQPPGGSVVPDAMVMSVGVVVTPVHVPVFDEATVIPVGIGSVNGAVSTSGAKPELPSVIVNVGSASGRQRDAGAIAFSARRGCWR